MHYRKEAQPLVNRLIVLEGICRLAGQEFEIVNSKPELAQDTLSQENQRGIARAYRGRVAANHPLHFTMKPQIETARSFAMPIAGHDGCNPFTYENVQQGRQPEPP